MPKIKEPVRQFPVPMSDDLRKRLAALAAAEDRSMAATVRQAIEDRLAEFEREKAAA